MYGNVSTANSKIAVDTDVAGGLYGAGKFGYSINSVASAGGTAATVAAITDIADVNFDVDTATGSLETVTIAKTEIAGFDELGVRAFRVARYNYTT